MATRSIFQPIIGVTIPDAGGTPVVDIDWSDSYVSTVLDDESVLDADDGDPIEKPEEEAIEFFDRLLGLWPAKRHSGADRLRILADYLDTQTNAAPAADQEVPVP